MTTEFDPENVPIQRKVWVWLYRRTPVREELRAKWTAAKNSWKERSSKPNNPGWGATINTSANPSSLNDLARYSLKLWSSCGSSGLLRATDFFGILVNAISWALDFFGLRNFHSLSNCARFLFLSLPCHSFSVKCKSSEQHYICVQVQTRILHCCRLNTTLWRNSTLACFPRAAISTTGASIWKLFDDLANRYRRSFRTARWESDRCFSARRTGGRRGRGIA